MARQPLDVRLAAQTESFRIRMNSLAPNLRGSFSKLSRIERLFYITVGITAVLMAVSIVFVRTKTLEVQSSTNELRIQTYTTQTQITQNQQALQDLTASGKVYSTANQAGLSGNSNVTKITK